LKLLDDPLVMPMQFADELAASLTSRLISATVSKMRLSGRGLILILLLHAHAAGEPG
jgi:hypothetical protein